MNRNKPSKAFLALMILLASSMILFSSCEKTDPEINFSEDYYPLNATSEWQYLYEHYATGPDTNELWSTKTAVINLIGDTVVEGKSYKKIIGHGLYDTIFVRKEGSAYFGVYHNRYLSSLKEYKFLDEKLPAGSAWDFMRSDDSKTEFVIVAKHSSKTIKGVMYKDVIEVAESYYSKKEGGWRKGATIKHCYAKGIGEIYAHFPAVTLTYSNHHISLISYK